MMQRLILTFAIALMWIVPISAQLSEVSDSLEKELREVVVTAQQPATRLVGTTFVSTIAGSALQNLGTAVDVLEQLPMITVSDNAVEVVGRGAPEIYIDGHPMHTDDELVNLQSANIRTIELDMAPGPMYGSDTRAVLRITTRRNLLAGLSVVDRLEVDARRKCSAADMLDINYRTGVWDIFATVTGDHNAKIIKGNTANSLVYDGLPTMVGSSQHNYISTNAATLKAGFNYSGDTRSFGAYYRFNPEHSDFVNNGNEWIGGQPYVARDIFRETSSRNHLASLYYDNTLSGKYHLHFDGDYRHAISKTGSATHYPDASADEVSSSDKRRSSLWAAKLLLDFPLAMGRLTIGTQDSYTRTALDYHMHNEAVGTYIPSSFTDTRQISAALFASWSRMFGPLSLSAGLRYEYIDYDFSLNGVRDTDVSRTDNLLTPDLSLGYAFSDDAQLSVSYRMSTVKPPYAQLTGSLNYVGMHEIEGGNPSLRDEHMHDIQLFGMWNGFMLQADFIRSIDTYGFVKRLYPSSALQLLMQPVNIDVSSVDIYAIWSKRVGIWTPNITLGLYKQWLELDGMSHNRPIFSYYFDNIISMPGGFALTVNASGQTRGDMHTNRFGTTACVVNASLGRTFLHDSLQIKVSATDIFNSRNNDWSMATYGICVDKHQSYDRRGISLSATYRFHPVKSKYKGTHAAKPDSSIFNP